MRSNTQINMRHYAEQPSRKRWPRRLLWVAAGLAVLFVLANGALWLAYRGRALPNYSLGPVDVGGAQMAEARERVARAATLLPAQITLTTPGTSKAVATDQLGVEADVTASMQRLEDSRSWLPLLAFFRHTTVPVVLKTDEQAFGAAMAQLAKDLYTKPLPERIVFDGEAFAIAEPAEGYRVERAELEPLVRAALQGNQPEIAVPAAVEAPPAGTANLAPELEKLQGKLSAKITYQHAGQRAQPAPHDIGGWYVQDGQTVQPNEERIGEYVAGVAQRFGIAPYNQRDAVAAALYALENDGQINFVLSAQAAPVKYTYCVQARGVDGNRLTAFARQAAAVYGDPRGWNGGGQIAFVRADSGCDFTLWLAAAAEVPAFGWPCDAVWSCRVGRNVIVNVERWDNATDPWKAAGQSLTDYRALVINHETGHWLGFGHPGCPGPGQLAPVMMQQSIEMNGCKFNAWPTESELNTAKHDRGIAALPPRETELLAHDSCCCAHCASSRS